MLLCFTAKSKTLSGRCSDSLSGSQSIRRTASLDTIYLKGQWPRESYYMHSSLLVDKSTQVNILLLSEVSRGKWKIRYLCHQEVHLFAKYISFHFLQTEECPNEPRKMHTRHPTEQTVADEKLEKNYFRHRYMFTYYRPHPSFVPLRLLKNLHAIHTHSCRRLQRTNKEGTSSRERTAAFGLIMPGGPPPALPGDHSVLLPSIASQTSMREWSSS